MKYAKRIVLNGVFFWFLIGGICHFARTAWFVQIVPPYLPQPMLLVWISGAFELLGAAGLLFERSRKAAGNGLAWLTACVTPANVYMLQQHQLFAQFPVWLLVLRLVFQVVLIAGIVWSTRPKRWRFR